MSTVILLGAGASYGSEFNLPMMEGFFRTSDLEGEIYSNLKKYILSGFPSTPLANLNLEDVITHLELSLEGFGKHWEPNPSGLLQIKNEIYDYIEFRLSIGEQDKWPNLPNCQHHTNIFTLKEEDSIITLNYDLVAEYSLAPTLPKERRNDKINYETILWAPLKTSPILSLM